MKLKAESKKKKTVPVLNIISIRVLFCQNTSNITNNTIVLSIFEKKKNLIRWSTLPKKIEYRSIFNQFLSIFQDWL